MKLGSALRRRLVGSRGCRTRSPGSPALRFKRATASPGAGTVPGRQPPSGDTGRQLSHRAAGRAAAQPGASSLWTRVVKAFNALYGRITAQNPRRTDGRLVVFLAGDGADAKATVSAFADSMGFAPVDLGGLQHDAGRLMQVGGGPLSGLHVVKLE